MFRFPNKMVAENAVRISQGPIPLVKSLMKEVKRYLRLGDKYPFTQSS